MTKSKCCFFCTQQNYKLWCLLQWFIPHTVIVDIVYWQYNWNIWPQNSIPWLRIFFTWPVYFICIATAVRRNCGLTTCSWKVKISFLNAYFVTHTVNFLIHCKLNPEEFMFPKLLSFLRTHEMKISSHLFCKNSNCSKCFIRVEETYIFLLSMLVKRSLHFGALIVSISLTECQAVNTNRII